jgi:phage shock protein A
MLRDEIRIVQEEVDKLRDRIASDIAAGRQSPQSLKSLQAAARSLERCMAALDRHTSTHLRGTDGRRSPSSIHV